MVHSRLRGQFRAATNLSGIRLRMNDQRVRATDAMRSALKGRIGAIIVTPPKLPANDGLMSLMRRIVMSSGLLALGLAVASDAAMAAPSS